MPIGPYKDFGACVAAQKKKGRSDESAKKICGEIEKRTKESKGEVNTEEIERTIAAQMWAEGVLRSNKKENK